MKRIGSVTVLGVAAVAALYGLLATGSVGFYSWVPLDNDPLTNSIAVTSISSNRLTLADGRVLVMLGYDPDRLAKAMRDSGGRVELGSVQLGSEEPRFASVRVKSRRFICGTGRPAVVIPLLRSEYPRYYSLLIGVGEFQ